MKLSKRARRGIRIFNRIQTGQKSFMYLLSQTKIADLKEKANGIIRAGREGNAEGITPSAPNADASGEVQHDLHDVHADDAGRTAEVDAVSPPAAPGA